LGSLARWLAGWLAGFKALIPTMTIILTMGVYAMGAA